MKRTLRLFVVSALALGFAGAMAQDADVIVPAPESATAAAKPGAAEGKCHVTDPCAEVELGAAAMEPDQALVDPPEVEATKAHEAWVESIWNSP
jgi:hypothetical protein